MVQDSALIHRKCLAFSLSCRPYLTNPDTDLRNRGVRFLSDVLHRLVDFKMSEKEGTVISCTDMQGSRQDSWLLAGFQGEPALLSSCKPSFQKGGSSLTWPHKTPTNTVNIYATNLLWWWCT